MIRCPDTPAGMSRIPQPSYVDPTMYGPRPRHKWRGNGYSSWFHHVTDTGLVVKAAKRFASHPSSFGGVPNRGLETALVVVAPTAARSHERQQRNARAASFRMFRSTALNCIGRVDCGINSGGWRGFEEAREYARSFGFESELEWRELLKREEGSLPPDIPSNPDQVYKDNGWRSWPDFLGYPAVFWYDFDKARNYVWRLGLKSQDEWWEWSKSGERPPDIPTNPHTVYKDEGWLSWGDFLGYNKGKVAGEWRGFEEARDCVWSLGIKSQDEWEELSKSGNRPPDIPTNPARVYKGEGWLSWGDFLGYNKGYVAGEWRDFEEARNCVWILGFKSHDEWKEWSKSKKKPHDIPSRPDRVYKGEGWLSWGDFLGYNKGYVAGEWRDFEEARNCVWILGLNKSHDEWKEWSKSKKKPHDIPSRPDRVYKGEGWLSWGDFLGYNKGYEYVAGEWRGFEEARDCVWSLGLESKDEWQELSKSGNRPPDIPTNPARVYKGEGWLSWGDFLGYRPGHIAGKRKATKKRSFS